MLALTSTMALAFSASTPAPTCDADVEYAFSLTTLDQTDTADWHVPDDKCFDPITLTSLKESGHEMYTWVPWSMINSDLAPNGAFVYKMSDGSILYKKITNVDPSDPSAALKFHKAQEMVETTFFSATTFEEVRLALGRSQDELVHIYDSRVTCSHVELTHLPSRRRCACPRPCPYLSAHTHTHAHAHAHTDTHTHAHAHAHTPFAPAGTPSCWPQWPTRRAQGVSPSMA